MIRISTAGPRTTRHLLAVGVCAIVASACSDANAPSPETRAPLMIRLNCSGDASGIACTPTSQGSATTGNRAVSLDRVLGGQNIFVRLAATSNTFDAATNRLTSTVTVQNLTDQPLGTRDGVTMDANAVRVFFHTEPTNGVSIVNATGSATFTASNQPFFRYDQVLQAGATSNPEAWVFQLPSASTTFTFQLYVAGRQPDENSPVRVAALGVELVTDANVPWGLEPVFLTAPAGDDRLFIVEKRGRVRIFKNGAMMPTFFLDIESKVSAAGEQGLLSIAFDPMYASNGYFYTYSNNLDGDIVVERYGSTPGSDVANPAPTPMVVVPHPERSNHNGGLVMFGPDGYLYLATGDGGFDGSTAQDPASRLGKMLRINVRSEPFVAETWASGLRNPWRFDFDVPASDPSRIDLFIADVGAGGWEEINLATGNPAGLNYGWNVQEGYHCSATGQPCTVPGFHTPVVAYDHSQGCSITGGFVYRGSAIPWLKGQYVYSDYCAGFLRTLSGNATTGFSVHQWSVPSLGNVTSFGEDSRGELYVMNGASQVFRIVPR